jgi:hypothetical protein
MAQDDTTPDSSTGEEEEVTDDRPEQPGSQPDTTDGEGGDGEEKEPTIPYSRFKQVNDVAQWYRRNIGSTEKVQQFNQWLASQEQQTKQQDPEAQYSKTQLEQVRAVMRQADAGYRELMEERERTKAEQAQAEEMLLDDTHDEIMKLAKANGLPVKDDEVMKAIGQSVMLTIKNDHKLLRQWLNGDLSTVGAAFEKLQKAIGGSRKGAGQMGNVARIKRQVVGLPTAPSGGAGTVTSVPAKAKDEKGITKSTHDRAWAMLQQQSE